MSMNQTFNAFLRLKQPDAAQLNEIKRRCLVMYFRLKCKIEFITTNSFLKVNSDKISCFCIQREPSVGEA